MRARRCSSISVEAACRSRPPTTSSPASPPERGLDVEITAHVLRQTFATTLVRGGTDLVIVAAMLGHARLGTTRGYTRPTAADRARALDLLAVDE